MNREIKFRAIIVADGGAERMEYFGAKEFDNGINAWPCSDEIKHIDEYVSPLMQFTGLKDKNGKEIYEGDIVTRYFPLREKDKYENGRIIWAKVRCAFVLEFPGPHINKYTDLTSIDSDGTVNVETQTDYHIEIIGNIYQHPELLK